LMESVGVARRHELPGSYMTLVGDSAKAGEDALLVVLDYAREVAAALAIAGYRGGDSFVVPVEVLGDLERRSDIIEGIGEEARQARVSLAAAAIRGTPVAVDLGTAIYKLRAETERARQYPD